MIDNDSLTRKEKEHLQRKADIVKVAAKLFSQKGHHNVTMQEIALKSEFSVGTLYKFFSNKDDLYTGIVSDLANTFNERFSNCMKNDDDEYKALVSWAYEKLNIFKEKKEMVELFCSLFGHVSSYFKEGVDEALFLRYKNNIAKLEDLFRRGIEKGLFIDESPALLTQGFEAIVNELFYKGTDEAYLAVVDEDLDATLRIFFGSVKK